MTKQYKPDNVDFNTVYDTFQTCSEDDRVAIESYYRAVKDSQQEYFDFNGIVVEEDMVNGMPGLLVTSSDSSMPDWARIVSTFDRDNALEIRFIDSDGSVQFGGIVTSITITSESADSEGAA